MTFSPDRENLMALAEVVDAKRRCCRFLRFVITVEPDGVLFRSSVPDLQAHGHSSAAC